MRNVTGETSRHFSTHVREPLSRDKVSHIFKHLQNSQHCRTLCSADCFNVLDHASSSFQLKMKEAIKREPSLNSPCKSKTILMTLTLSRFTSFCCHISIFTAYFKFYFQRFVYQSTEDERRICRNMSLKLKSFVVYLKLSQS